LHLFLLILLMRVAHFLDIFTSIITDGTFNNNPNIVSLDLSVKYIAMKLLILFRRQIQINVGKSH